MQTTAGNTTEPCDALWHGADVISTYSRQDAIEDGVLVDVSQSNAYRDAGFAYPVALTTAVFEIVNGISPRHAHETFDARLYDVLFLARIAARRHPNADTVHFQVLMTPRHGPRRTFTFKMICGPGDDGEPVLTILLPDED